MIIGENRPAVIENIRAAAESGDFHKKVELNDPVLTAAEARRVTDRYLAARKTAPFRLKTRLARAMANAATALVNRDTEIVGDAGDAALAHGVIFTSNHFSPLENTVIRHFARRKGFRSLDIVSQVTNFAMTGVIGFLMNYADTIPLAPDARYMTHDFLDVLRERLDAGAAVLIYPEEEMWFNYRKPRPPKRGAYYFAAKLGRPVVSCFVEILDLPEPDGEGFRKVRYRLHILGEIYPDPSKSVRDASAEMCRTDYALKKAAYEKAYGKPLTYAFSPDDIAGWDAP